MIADTTSEPTALSRLGRPFLLTVVVGVVIVLVFALIFAVAQQTRGITHSAESLHSADEALRVATTARAQLALGVVVANVDLVIGSNSSDQLEISRSETESALVLLGDSMDELESRRKLDGSLRESANEFTKQSRLVLGLMQANDPMAARNLAESDLDKSWTLLQIELIRERDLLNSEVASSDAFLAWMRMLAGFLVAFLVPTAVILIFREFARRQAKQTDLEGTLRTEREVGKAREDFVANASHELRTPLTSIYGLALLLEEDPAIVDSQSAHELIDMIVSESTDLSRMVDDLLTTARLDADALHYTFENVDIAEEIEEVVGPMLRGGLHIAVSSVEATIRVDRLRFRQILRNLISNALKYGGPNLSLSTEVVDGRFMMSVTDDGEGIPADLESRLFQRFMHQGHQPLVLGSVGLGLSIVRALADGMGGSVQYVRENGMTSFVIVMPLVSVGKPSVAPLVRTTIPSGYHEPVSLDIAASEPYRKPGRLP